MMSGPLKFRLVLQPSCFLAIRSGLADAKEGNPPYFWELLSDPAERDRTLKDGSKSVGRVFLLALAFVLRFVYPGEAIIVATVLAIIPYIILHGVVTRLARRKSEVPTIGKHSDTRKAA